MATKQWLLFHRKHFAKLAALLIGLTFVSSSRAASFRSLSQIAVPRTEHTATLLQNGKVLLVGGQSRAGVNLSSVELYDPAAGSAVAVASLSAPRAFHTA